jgi:hypothetical protein
MATLPLQQVVPRVVFASRYLQQEVGAWMSVFYVSSKSYPNADEQQHFAKTR